MRNQRKSNLILLVIFAVALAGVGRAIYLTHHMTGLYSVKFGGNPIYDWEPVANAQQTTLPSGGGAMPRNGCQGTLVPSAGVASATAGPNCNIAAMNGCVGIVPAGPNIAPVTPVLGAVVNCAVTQIQIVTVVGTASATASATGVVALFATANWNSTASWLGY